MRLVIETAVLLLFLLGACTGPAREPQAATASTLGRPETTGLADEHEAILRLLRSESEAMVAKDIKGLARLWAEDSTVTDAHHTPADPNDDAVWRGIDAVLDRYMVVVFPGNPQYAEPGDVQIQVTGDQATARSTTRIGNEVSPGGDLWVFRRQDGRWQITALTYNLEPG